MPPMTVLVVEDQLGYRELICEAIADLFLDVVVRSAGDGEDAWTILTSPSEIEPQKYRNPDLIITDLNMPRSSGLDFLKRVKQHECFKAIPVVIFTTSSDQVDITHCYEAQANCYVMKPANIDMFFDVVQSIVKFWLGVAALPQTLQQCCQFS